MSRRVAVRSPRWAGAAVATALLVACACDPRGHVSDADDASAPRLYRDRKLLMGTTFDIQVVADDAATAEKAVGAAFEEVARVEELLSEWRETSEISAVNRAAGGEPVAVGPELLEVVRRARHASELTGGAFDITFAGCGSLWSFAEPEGPGDDTLRDCLSRVGFSRVELDEAGSTIRLPHRDMTIGIAGIGKGYGVDRAAAELERNGIARYLVDGGGDLRVRGRNVDRAWRVGVAHPRAPGEVYGTLEIDSGSIVTSGDYQNYFERGGVRYHHILDPETGRPARRSVAVSVIAPDATDADALATGLFVMGPDDGLALVESLPGVEALFFDPDMRVRGSSGFPELE